MHFYHISKLVPFTRDDYFFLEVIVMKKRINVYRLVLLALFAAISSVLMYLEFALPIFPGFLKLDFSEFPALIAAFMFGPLGGIAVALVKNLLHLPVSLTGGVGELANFVISSALVGTAGLIYKFRKTKSGALIGMAAGTVAMCVTGFLANYFVMLPLYDRVMGFTEEKIVAISSAIIPFIKNKFDVVLWSITPFNLFKGIIMSTITFLLYKHLSTLIKKTPAA